MPSADPQKPTKGNAKMRSMVESAVSVLDEKKRPAAELVPDSVLEEAAVRTTLKRNRSYGDIDIELIRPDPDQVRKVDTQSQGFAELLASVREHGVLEPITVRVVDHGGKIPYQIVTGERRYQAAVRAELKTVPAIVREVDDTTKAVHQLVENLQRENMNPIEEARAFHRYIAATGHTQEQLAKRIGKSRVYVTQIMGILEKLSRDEQAELAQRQTSDIPGKSLFLEALRIQDPKTRLSVLRGELRVREARDVVKRERNAPDRPRGFGRRYVLEKQNATVTVTFKKSRASEDEIGQALLEAYQEHKRRARREVT